SGPELPKRYESQSLATADRLNTQERCRFRPLPGAKRTLRRRQAAETVIGSNWPSGGLLPPSSAYARWQDCHPPARSAGAPIPPESAEGRTFEAAHTGRAQGIAHRDSTSQVWNVWPNSHSSCPPRL